MKITFLGACGTVTGSRILIEYHHHRFLLDCGLYQGAKELRELNIVPFPDADQIEAVIISHAHIDHCGYLPKLVKEGFRGPIYGSPATCDLLKIMLLDAAYLQEEDAEFANRTGHSSHKPALPLFTKKDAQKALTQVVSVDFHQWKSLASGIGFQLLRAGHILGASIVEIAFQDLVDHSKKLIFTGDLGHERSEFICDPEIVRNTDVLIFESTYGDRAIPQYRPTELAQIINRVLQRAGTLIIPAFALGRSQEILFKIRNLERNGLIEPYPVYLDSPMANDVTDIYLEYQEDLKVRYDSVEELWPKHMRFIRDTEESMLLAMSNQPKIIISASGMLQGGRVLHHLKSKLNDEKNGVLFVGYQGIGTKGRLLKNGIPKIRLHHQEINVCAEIFSLDSLSSHADSNELMNWLKNFEKPPEKIFLIHGEDEARRALSYRIQSELGWLSIIPKIQEAFVL